MAIRRSRTVRATPCESGCYNPSRVRWGKYMKQNVEAACSGWGDTWACRDCGTLWKANRSRLDLIWQMATHREQWRYDRKRNRKSPLYVPFWRRFVHLVA